MLKIDNHRGEILQGAATSFVFRVLGGSLEFLFHVLIARLLGAEGAGLFFLALTAATISSVFGRLGLENAMLRFVAASHDSRDWAAVRGVVQHGLALGIGVSAIFALLLLVSAGYWVPLASEHPDAKIVVIIMLLSAPAMSGLVLHAEMLKGLRKVGWSQVVMSVAPFGIGILLLLLLVQRFGISGAASGYSISIYLALCLGIWRWRRSTPELRGVAPQFSRRKLIRTAAPLLIVKSLNLAAGWLATFTLAALTSIADVGVFNVALRTSLLLGLFLISLNSIAAPKFAAFHQRQDFAGLADTARWTTLLLAVLTLPVFVLFLGFPDWVMSLFGAEFVEKGKAVLFVLTFGQIVNVLTGPVTYLLMMTGHEKDVRTSSLMSFSLCLFSIWPFIKLWGVAGAAGSVACSIAAMNIICAFYVRRRLGFFTIPIQSSGK